MRAIKPVTISKKSFLFCRTIIAMLAWLSLLNKTILCLISLIMALSAVLKVQKAPLILLYDFLTKKLGTSEKEVVDESGIRFSHIVAAFFSAISFLVWTFLNPWIGMALVTVLAVLQTMAVFGKCSALKLYTCMNNPNGECCKASKAFLRGLRR